MYCEECGNIDCNLMDYETLKHFKGEKIMNKEDLEQWVHNEICKIESIKEDKSSHKNCINKKKFMQYLKNTYRLNGYYAEVYKPIKTRIKDGWFDNE